MKIKSFVFGLGCGFMILSVFIYFFYSLAIKGAGGEESVGISDAEIVERAKRLGMVTMTEALESGFKGRPADKDIIDMAARLGMVFPDNAESDLITDETAAADETDADDTAGGGEGLGLEAPEAQAGADGNQADGGQEEPVEAEKPVETEKPDETAINEEPRKPEETQAVVEEAPEATEATMEAAEAGNPDETAEGGGVTADNADDLSENESFVSGGEGEGKLVLVEINQGLNANEIASKLYNAGIVGDAESFLNFLKENNVTKRIVYGKYFFYQGEPYESILRKLTL